MCRSLRARLFVETSGALRPICIRGTSVKPGLILASGLEGLTGEIDKASQGCRLPPARRENRMNDARSRLPIWQHSDQASGAHLRAYDIDGQLHDAIAPFGSKPQRCHIVGDIARLECHRALPSIDVAQVPRVLRRVATEG